MVHGPGRRRGRRARRGSRRWSRAPRRGPRRSAPGPPGVAAICAAAASLRAPRKKSGTPASCCAPTVAWSRAGLGHERLAGDDERRRPAPGAPPGRPRRGRDRLVSRHSRPTIGRCRNWREDRGTRRSAGPRVAPCGRLRGATSSPRCESNAARSRRTLLASTSAEPAGASLDRLELALPAVRAGRSSPRAQLRSASEPAVGAGQAEERGDDRVVGQRSRRRARSASPASWSRTLGCAATRAASRASRASAISRRGDPFQEKLLRTRPDRAMRSLRRLLLGAALILVAPAFAAASHASCRPAAPAVRCPDRLGTLFMNAAPRPLRRALPAARLRPRRLRQAGQRRAGRAGRVGRAPTRVLRRRHRRRLRAVRVAEREGRDRRLRHRHREGRRAEGRPRGEVRQHAVGRHLQRAQAGRPRPARLVDHDHRRAQADDGLQRARTSTRTS